MGSNAAYAVMTKSRAKYGKRLTEQNYRELLNLSSVDEIAGYLKTQTHYASALGAVQEKVIHRGYLEKLLRGKIFADFANLCHFEKSVGEHLFEYIVLRGDISQLLQFIRYYNAGHPEEYLFDLPIFFNRHTQIDLIALSKVKSFDELLQIFSASPLAKVIAGFRPVSGYEIDYSALEAALNKYLFAFATEMLKKYSFKKAADELKALFATQAELENLRIIYRSKKYFHLSKEMLSALLIPQSNHFTKRQTREMIDAEEIKSIDEILLKSYYHKFLRATAPTYIDEYIGRVLYKTCRKYMRFSSDPAVVMVSCIYLFELEIEDITSIIEGVRYKMPPEQIRRRLLAFD